jgi:Ser/Thr protein kinase RdoA (MazF antagonist)
MWSVGWEALDRWGDDVARIKPLAGGATLSGRQTCVVHADANVGNVRMTADRVALINWDESHADVLDLDLVLPHNAAGLEDGALNIAAQASAAWEAAICWNQAARRSSSGLS